MFDLMFRPLRHYADFEGRSTRGEYWLFYLFNVVVGALIGFVTATLNHIDSINMLNQNFHVSPLNITLNIIWTVAVFVPSLAVAVRRLHDTNRSGWWILILLLPILGVIWWFVLMILPGTIGENTYGPNPLEEN